MNVGVKASDRRRGVGGGRVGDLRDLDQIVGDESAVFFRSELGGQAGQDRELPSVVNFIGCRVSSDVFQDGEDILPVGICRRAGWPGSRSEF